MDQDDIRALNEKTFGLHNDEAALREEWQAEAREMTIEKLPAFLNKLANFKHDYGSIVVALGAAATGAAWAMEHSPTGGITGFQASGVTWEFIMGWDCTKRSKPLRLVDYEDLCYPQYEGDFRTIGPVTWKWVRERAETLLKETPNAAPEVIAHWKNITEGYVPFGLELSGGEGETNG